MQLFVIWPAVHIRSVYNIAFHMFEAGRGDRATECSLQKFSVQNLCSSRLASDCVRGYVCVCVYVCIIVCVSVHVGVGACVCACMCVKRSVFSDCSL